GRVLVLTALHCRAAAPGTGGSWLAAGCASISRWNAKIRPTHHARSGRLGADVGARRTAPPGSTAPRQLTYGPLYALSAPGYRRHRPETTLLYQLVAEHYPK